MYSIEHKPLKHIFGLNVDESVTVPVRVYTDETNPVTKYVKAHIPKQEPYLFRNDLLRDMLAWINDGDAEPILLKGPTGCGKSSLAMQIAARLNIPIWVTTGNEEMEVCEIFGQFILGDKGNTVFMDGPATQAARYGGWYLIDEIDRLRPGVTVGLNGLLDQGPFTLAGKGGEVVTPAEGSRIIATANTNMTGDETGGYNTAHIHDKSVLERFGMIINVKYADDDAERALVAKVFEDLKDDELKYWFTDEDLEIASTNGGSMRGEFVTRHEFIESMLRFRGMIRNQSVESGNMQGNAFERTFSTRTLLRWAKAIKRYSGYSSQGISALHYSLERVLTNGCTSSTKIAIHQILKDVFGVNYSAE
jgi:cobaltochelatase CobS